MDPQRGVCMGCCRTLDEIAQWSQLDEATRAAIMASLPERRKKLNVPEVAVPPLA